MKNTIYKKQCKNTLDFSNNDFKSDKFLLADVFKSFRKIWLKVYHLDPVKFLPAPGLAW